MASVCAHLSSPLPLRKVSPSTTVHNEECTMCFATSEDPLGLLVCITCFNGACEVHARRHAEVTGHNLALRIVKVKVQRHEEKGQEPAKKVTKLAIGVEGGFPAVQHPDYEYETAFTCLSCAESNSLSNAAASTEAREWADAVVAHHSVSDQANIDAWEEERVACEHSAMLVQDSDAKKLDSSGKTVCGRCEMNENIWLCLTCGNLGCGRPIWGKGGNGHSLEHYNESRHPIMCKLGTITPGGTADIFCYACDDMRLDNCLAEHLNHVGVALTEQRKTDKSMAELELEQNLNHEWSKVIERGEALQLLWGPGHTGLQNIGNSCYMASILQVLFSLEAFQARYYDIGQVHLLECRSTRPAQCFQCQMAKLAHGLWSGEYSKMPPGLTDSTLQMTDIDTRPEPVAQPGISTSMVKALITENHQEFRSTRQQDALEFFQYLLQYIQQQERKAGTQQDPTTSLTFQQQNRLQCQQCHQVRYHSITTSEVSVPIPDDAIPPQDQLDAQGKDNVDEMVWPEVSLQACVDAFAAASTVDYSCCNCNTKTQVLTTQRFETAPDVLMIHVRRFVCRDGIPRKIGTRVVPPSDILDLEHLRGKGLQPDETELPEEPEAPVASFVANEDMLQQLVSMGFGRNRCLRALEAVSNAGAEPAMNWLIERIDDAGLDEAIVPPDAVDEAAVSSLSAMGFAPDRCKYALKQTQGSVERALDWLFSHPDDAIDDAIDDAAEAPKAGSATALLRYRLKAVVTHLGASTSFGHYVAHVWRPHEQRWVYYNDAKVAESLKPPLDKAYMYFYVRADD